MSEKKRVLLTGATGFLGSNLIRSLLQAGHQVVGLKRQGSSLRRLNEFGDQILLRNVEETDLPSFLSSGEPFRAVVHTAVCYGRNGETSEQIFEANTAFPSRLMAAAAGGSQRANGMKRAASTRWPSAASSAANVADSQSSEPDERIWRALASSAGRGRPCWCGPG